MLEPVLNQLQTGASKDPVLFSKGQEPGALPPVRETHRACGELWSVNVVLVSVCVAPSHLTALNKTLINTRSLNAPYGMVGACVCVCPCTCSTDRLIHQRHYYNSLQCISTLAAVLCPRLVAALLRAQRVFKPESCPEELVLLCWAVSCVVVLQICTLFTALGSINHIILLLFSPQWEQVST